MPLCYYTSPCPSSSYTLLALLLVCHLHIVVLVLDGLHALLVFNKTPLVGLLLIDRKTAPCRIVRCNHRADLSVALFPLLWIEGRFVDIPIFDLFLFLILILDSPIVFIFDMLRRVVRCRICRFVWEIR